MPSVFDDRKPGWQPQPHCYRRHGLGWIPLLRQDFKHPYLESEDANSCPSVSDSQSCCWKPVIQWRSMQKSSALLVIVPTIMSVMWRCHKYHMEKKSAGCENQQLKNQSSCLGPNTSASLGLSSLAGSYVQWLQCGRGVRRENLFHKRGNQSKS